MNWAMQQRTDGPSAQIVLYIVADTANENGVSRHADPGYIAERSRQSRATVFRRLDELEKAGALTRFKKVRPDGAPVYEIRLALDREIDYSGAHHGQAPADATPEADQAVAEVDTPDIEAESQIETLTAETPPVSPVRQPESHLCDSMKNPSKSPDSPQSPSLPNEPDDPDFDSRFEKFTRAYPVPIADVPLTRTLLRAMTEAEIENVTFAAWGYRKMVTDEDRRAMDAHRFIRDGKWLGYVESGREAAPKPPKPPPPEQWLAEDSDEFRALCLACDIAKRSRPAVITRMHSGGPLTRGQRAYRYVGHLAYGAAGMAALAVAEPKLMLTSEWRVVEKGSREFFAWSDRVFEWIGVRPEAYRIWLCACGQLAERPMRADKLSLPPCKEGLLVPTPWPPAKGTGSKTEDLDSIDPPFHKAG